jgi:hypothetical protein
MGWTRLRAILLALTWAALFVLATPGMDAIDPKKLRSERGQRRIERRYGATVAQLAGDLAWAQVELRRPVERLLNPIQRPLRISQEWALYGDGPDVVRRMEIRLDGALRHRSGDPRYTWLNEQLRCRRLRPMVESAVRKDDATNRVGLASYVAERAWEDFPGTRVVELVASASPYPGDQPRYTHALRVTGPGQKPEDIELDQLLPLVDP